MDNYVRRITPACAGNSWRRRSYRGLRWDHPRVCGEQPAHHGPDHGPQGSPPRVRGTGLCPGEAGRIRRITPACAGNSWHVPQGPGRFQDHPRVCGEQMKTSDTLQVGMGSPPRVRGTGRIRIDAYESTGITPACAGNRRRYPRYSVPPGDHPRVCREQYTLQSRRPTLSGSPPRVRGTENLLHTGRNGCGITPACAGNRAWC